VSTWESGAAVPPPSGAAAAGSSEAVGRAGTGDGRVASLDALLDVSMPVMIEIGRTSMTVQEVLDLSAGSVIELEKLVGEPVDIYVSDRRLAQGEIVVVGDHFGVRVTRVLPGAAEGQA
jgi:flagellar motor switch protein FliN/FliY